MKGKFADHKERTSMRARSSSFSERSRRMHHTILRRLRSSCLITSNLSKSSFTTSEFSTSRSSSPCSTNQRDGNCN